MIVLIAAVTSLSERSDVVILCRSVCVWSIRMSDFVFELLFNFLDAMKFGRLLLSFVLKHLHSLLQPLLANRFSRPSVELRAIVTQVREVMHIRSFLDVCFSARKLKRCRIGHLQIFTRIEMQLLAQNSQRFSRRVERVVYLWDLPIAKLILRIDV